MYKYETLLGLIQDNFHVDLNFMLGQKQSVYLRSQNDVIFSMYNL